MDSEYHQLMLERTQMLVEALTRAATGVATPDDWNTICTECGVPKSSIFKLDRRKLWD